MNKELYEKPIIEVIKLIGEDIITESETDPHGGHTGFDDGEEEYDPLDAATNDANANDGLLGGFLSKDGASLDNPDGIFSTGEEGQEVNNDPIPEVPVEEISEPIVDSYVEMPQETVEPIENPGDFIE